MLKLELKRIFSKKINVFAIGLALILAVIFSGFAVTSNRYVDAVSYTHLTLPTIA